MFNWMTPVVMKGYRQALVHEDLVGSPFDLSAERLYKRYLKVVADRKAKGKHGIKGALWKVYQWQFLLAWALLLFSEACNMALPVFVGLITYVQLVLPRCALGMTVGSRVLFTVCRDFLVKSASGVERPDMSRGIGLAFGLVGTVYVGALSRVSAPQFRCPAPAPPASCDFHALSHGCADARPAADSGFRAGHAKHSLCCRLQQQVRRAAFAPRVFTPFYVQPCDSRISVAIRRSAVCVCRRLPSPNSPRAT